MARHKGSSARKKEGGAAPPGTRPLRVGEEIRHALSAVFARGELRDPELIGVSITVTEVRVSPDLLQATAFVAPLGGGDIDKIVAALHRAAPYIRGQVVKAVKLRRAPNLGFVPDTSFDYASRIDAALRQPTVRRDTDGEDS
jgi:ribosome-binding factor A